MRQRNKILSILFLVLFFIFPLTLIIASAANDTSQPAATAGGTRTPPAPASPTDESLAKAEVSDQLIIGDPKAKVTIVEYGDFQCPICGQFFEQTEPDIKKAYLDTGKAKLEFRVETHIGPESVRAAEAAYCANDQKQFPAYHDKLYSSQNGVNDGAFSDANLKRFANDLGLDAAAFDTCLTTNKHLAKVEASNAEAKTRGVTSTPTIFIQDTKVVGAQPFSIYQRLIDAQL